MSEGCTDQLLHSNSRSNSVVDSCARVYVYTVTFAQMTITHSYMLTRTQNSMYELSLNLVLFSKYNNFYTQLIQLFNDAM